jgi:flagellar biosynthetic protein FliQ
MDVLDLWRGALLTTALVGAPFLIVTLAVGLLIGVVQAATQLQENVLVFVPKLLAVGLVLAIGGHWLLGELVRYTERSAAAMVDVARQER